MFKRWSVRRRSQRPHNSMRSLSASGKQITGTS